MMTQIFAFTVTIGVNLGEKLRHESCRQQKSIVGRGSPHLCHRKDAFVQGHSLIR